MPPATSLKRYIRLLDGVILSGDTDSAEELQDEVLAVFEPELDGLRSKLTNDQPAVFASVDGVTIDSSSEVDFIKDARLLRSRLQVELEKIEPDAGEQRMRETVFISHRSTDKDVADMLKDFLVTSGIPNEKIFCSSLPGNDIKSRISAEVKKCLRESIVNILILSKDYYESAYCLNEAGIAWYLEDEVDAIAVCLPEIDEDNMWGFFNGENKVRRLNDENDVAAIYDTIRKRLNVPGADFSVVTRERQKLAQRYEHYIDGRKIDYASENSEDPDDHIDDNYTPVIGQYDVGNIPVEPAFLLVYAAAGNGQIMKVQTLGSPVQVSTSGKQFMADMTQRESARWVEALDILITWGWVKPVGNKGVVFELTGTGYKKADWLKEGMDINTENDPLDELKEFDAYAAEEKDSIELSELENRAFELLRNQAMGKQELAEKLGISMNAVIRLVKKLLDAGIIKSRGSARNKEFYAE